MEKEAKAFLERYNEFGSSARAFEAIGISDYNLRKKLIKYCKEKGYLIEPRKNIVLEITEKGKKFIRENEQ